MLSCVGYAILAYHEDSNVIVQDVLNSVLHFVVFQRGYFTHLSTSSKALLLLVFEIHLLLIPLVIIITVVQRIHTGPATYINCLITDHIDCQGVLTWFIYLLVN